jgi:hypothetical protein
MKANRIVILSSLSALLMGVSGCIFLVAGTLGAIGGYAISRDTIQGDYDVTYAEAWDAATEVSTQLGTVLAKDKGAGTVDAEVEGAKVHVQVSQLTSRTSRLKVKARKGAFPRMGTAERVFTKIVQDMM